MGKTIACISTPLGRGGIAVVRLSGQESLKIARQVFACKNLDFENITPRFMYLGNFDLDGAKEKCFLVYFKAPHSYTGEDLVEFQIHGGVLLAQKVLEKLLGKGAVMAEPGELSRRAFENGNISLDEAESIIGEINAESEGELRASLGVAGGALKNSIVRIQNELSNMLAEIEATLDYPEEDFEKETKINLLKKVAEIKKELEKFVYTHEQLRCIKYGVNVAIIGTPNVGKSSLLNALLGQERAIVTEIEGTTRDSITESLNYRGIKFNFVDTAGIRQTKDKVEQIGVQKSREFLSSSDIVLLVLDGSKELTKDEQKLHEEIKDKNHIVVINKNDLARKATEFKNEIALSALNKTNLSALLDAIYKKVITEEVDFNKLLVTNERQMGYLKSGLEIVKEIEDSKAQSMDIFAMLIKKLWNELGKITGQTENEQIIDLIFSKFCLGK